MKTKFKAASVVLAGFALGIAVMRGLHAGQPQAPPAFVISNIEVTDSAKYQKYAEASAAALGTYHGKILARGGKTVVFDGRPPQRLILIEFPSMADAQRWRSSPEFQKTQAAATTVLKLHRKFRD